ncbi:hypothetical protein MGYG_06501 [Nannizzia gypsea CBS 118893]|uniref:Uncharacterized protein n=1 Tax=Arthroderma gypseum (strain ATCC MYA-4604 / CBS 118893) TaxID=535722 RepID=E4UZH3_ARTGP|nr:hypothetical protein MGYG_06501 [Nannizzia gypsea CBS 118893]EFR03503.1 hypothetical protein MGYG_06501 [Nannizzia gypsea CBS 118893]
MSKGPPRCMTQTEKCTRCRFFLGSRKTADGGFVPLGDLPRKGDGARIAKLVVLSSSCSNGLSPQESPWCRSSLQVWVFASSPLAMRYARSIGLALGNSQKK